MGIHVCSLIKAEMPLFWTVANMLWTTVPSLKCKWDDAPSLPKRVNVCLTWGKMWFCLSEMSSWEQFSSTCRSEAVGSFSVFDLTHLQPSPEQAAGSGRAAADRALGEVRVRVSGLVYSLSWKRATRKSPHFSWNISVQDAGSINTSQKNWILQPSVLQYARTPHFFSFFIVFFLPHKRIHRLVRAGKQERVYHTFPRSHLAARGGGGVLVQL